MSRRNEQDMERVRELVDEYVGIYGVTDTRKIAKYVEERTGKMPSNGTISYILRNEMNYTSHRQPQFVWKHNAERHE